MESAVCRICLSQDNCFISISEKLGEQLIWAVINDIGNVSVSNSDEFSQIICNNCYKRLQDTINLRDEIQQTARLLDERKLKLEDF